MSLFPAIEVLLAEQGRKYNSPDQAGGLREMMLDLKAKGAGGSSGVSDLVREFQAIYPKLSLERTSNW